MKKIELEKRRESWGSCFKSQDSFLWDIDIVEGTTEPHFIDMETWPRFTQYIDGGPGGDL